jgi:tetratricopeptide (TPR) repeat protein
MQASSLKFCERSAELGVLDERWRQASNTHDPAPQVVVVAGEPGFGKTRLVFEFYRRLRKTRDETKDEPYWPDVLDDFEPTPDPMRCNLRAPIPYLWWGLRPVDGGGRGFGDQMAHSDRYLLPHLVALLARDRMGNQVQDIAAVLLGMGVDIVSSKLGIDTFVSVANGIFDTAAILRGAAAENSARKALDSSMSRADAVLADLSKVFGRTFLRHARIPGIIFIDDAQFLHDDVALPRFVELLLYTAVARCWPVMVLVTHRKRELALDTDRPHSFASIIDRARRGNVAEGGRAERIPGGYLHDGNYTEIDLGPVRDLSSALHEAFPGLNPAQTGALLERTGGYPQYLEQMIELLLRRERFFKDGKFSNALTEEGLKGALEATSSRSIVDLVDARLRQAPDDVQQALAFASLQGARFSNEIVEATAWKHLGCSLRSALGQAEDPFSMVLGTNKPRGGIGEFVVPLFQEVAEECSRNLPSLGGAGAVQESFRKVLAGMADDEALRRDESAEARLFVYGLAAHRFEKSDAPEERATAQRALGESASIQLSRYSFEAASASYERLLAIVPPAGTRSQWKSRIDTWEVLVQIYMNVHWPAKRSQAIKNMLRDAFALIGGERDVFIFATDRDAVEANFREWRERNPEGDPNAYLEAAAAVVRGLLNLSELARCWTALRVAEGDDRVGPAPFLIMLGKDSHDTDPPGPAYYLEIAQVLQERAYTVATLFGEGYAEIKHIGLLDALAQQAVRDEDYAVAADALGRSLEIARRVASKLDEADVLNKLGMVLPLLGEPEAAKERLHEAYGIVTAILHEPMFRASLAPHDGGDATATAGASPAVELPQSFHALFEEDVDAALREFQRLKVLAGNIAGNIATSALADDRTEDARTAFRDALELHRDGGKREAMAADLRSLAKIAASAGDVSAACAYWKQSLQIFQELEAEGGIVQNVWRAEAEQVQSVMREAGCELS